MKKFDHLPAGRPRVLPEDGLYPGLYRGFVVQNDDRPEKDGGDSKSPIGDDEGPMGRVRVLVPQVYGELQPEDCPWADVCVMAGGGPGGDDKLLSGVVWVPPVGTTVWVMFEHADPQRPVVIGGWYGKADETIEVPAEAIDRSRPPYETEKDRSEVEYPELYVFKPPGKKEDKEKLAMCIRFVGDKRIDVILDENNWIEIDDGGSPDDPISDFRDKMIRVNADRKIALVSTLEDPKAITLLATEGGIHIEAKKNVVTVSKEGSLYRMAGEAGGAISAGTGSAFTPQEEFLLNGLRKIGFLSADEERAIRENREGTIPETQQNLAEFPERSGMIIDASEKLTMVASLLNVIVSASCIEGAGPVRGSFQSPHPSC